VKSMVMFVLTGKAPETQPLVAEFVRRPVLSEQGGLDYTTVGRIVLAVSPFVSAETVERHYRKLQGEATGGVSAKIRPGTAALYCFVEQQLASGARPKWKDLYAKAQREHPDAPWANYHSHEGLSRPETFFWRAYKRAKKVFQKQLLPDPGRRRQD